MKRYITINYFDYGNYHEIHRTEVPDTATNEEIDKEIEDISNLIYHSERSYIKVPNSTKVVIINKPGIFKVELTQGK